MPLNAAKDPAQASARQTDTEVLNILRSELHRQQYTLQMIPSENYMSPAVLAAQASVLANKYAEGYPAKRYYQGNVHADEAERLAIERAKKLFGAEHANVQPLSGAPANQVIFSALLQPRDAFMGLRLDAGGHLTHGSPVNFSGKLYRAVTYGVDPETGMLDYEAIRQLALKEKPKLILSGFTAYPRKVDFKIMHAIAQEVGAFAVADISHIAGLVVAGEHPSPFPFTDVVMTTTHKTLRGPRGAVILCKQKFAAQMDKAVFPGLQGGPHMNSIAAKAVAFHEALQPAFREYARQIVQNAQVLAAALIERGMHLVSNGTDTHLLLIDLVKSGKAGKGKELAEALERAGIIVNANTIPFDPSTPFRPSGIRLGTPALTTRGMKENEMRIIAEWIAEIVRAPENNDLLEKTRGEVRELCSAFPIYFQQDT